MDLTKFLGHHILDTSTKRASLCAKILLEIDHSLIRFNFVVSFCANIELLFLKPRKKIKQMVADQQTRSAGAQIPGRVGLLKQTTMAVTYLQNCASHRRHRSSHSWWMGGGGRRWGVVEFELPVLPSHTIPHLPQKCAKASLLEINFLYQHYNTTSSYSSFALRNWEGQRLQVLTGRIVHIKL